MSLISPVYKVSSYVWGNVVPQLAELTGSKGFVNVADMPLIMRNVVHLSLTCKNLYLKLNTAHFNQTLIRTLARRFNKNEALVAAHLDTRGSRKWIWDHIQTKGYDAIYYAIQDIYSLVGRVFKEAKDAGLHFEVAAREEICPPPKPPFYQIDSGLFLITDRIPDILATPFGQVKLITLLSSKDALSITEMLLRHLKATYSNVLYITLSDARNESRVFDVSDGASKTFRQISYDDGRKLDQKELDREKGKRLVVVNRFASTMYAVEEVGDRVLGPAVWECADPLPVEVVQAMWKMLERDRMGQDPLMRLSTSAFATQEMPPTFKDMGQIASFVITLFTQLADQPLFPEDRSLTFPTKVLAVKNYRDASRAELLNKAAMPYLKENTHWRVYACGVGNRVSYQGKDIGPGLELWLSDGNKPCDLKDLRVAFDAVLTSLGLGWKPAKLKDFPVISLKRSEEDHFLFVKKDSTFSAEDILIRVVAEDLGLAKFIQCQSAWDDDTKIPYLWIRKDKFKQVSSALQLSV